MSNRNCGGCYFYDHINQRERTIYCRLWQERRSQFDSCTEWREHNNDPIHIKEAEAQRIRYTYERRRQHNAVQEKHKELVGLQKKSVSIRIIALIIAMVGIIVTIILYII